MNNDPARKLASNTHSYLMSKMPIEDRYSLQTRQVPVAQQTNGYDCGVHLLCNAKAATRHMLIYGSDDGMEKPAFSDKLVNRSDLRKLIIDLSDTTDEEGIS